MSSSIAIHSKLLLYQTGWWYTYPSEKYEFVSWDDDIPNIWKIKVHVPNHQPANVWVILCNFK